MSLSCSWSYGKTVTFPIKSDVICKFFIGAIYQLEEVSFYFSFVECFVMKVGWNPVKRIFCISWADHILLVLYFINMIYYNTWFSEITSLLSHTFQKCHEVKIPFLFNEADSVTIACACKFFFIELQFFVFFFFFTFGKWTHESDRFTVYIPDKEYNS